MIENFQYFQEHEPDPTYRSNQQLSFEGFVRYMTDATNYAFVPEEIKPDHDTLHYPLNYYYICSSHNTYLTGHQLKGESSTEMYRQVGFPCTSSLILLSLPIKLFPSLFKSPVTEQLQKKKKKFLHIAFICICNPDEYSLLFQIKFVGLQSCKL